MHRPSPWDFPQRDADWEIFDDPLCRLVDQSECKREVEVDFRFANAAAMRKNVEARAVKIVNSLPKFREKGRVRVWIDADDGSERIICSSDGVM